MEGTVNAVIEIEILLVIIIVTLLWIGKKLDAILIQLRINNKSVVMTGGNNERRH